MSSSKSIDTIDKDADSQEFLEKSRQSILLSHTALLYCDYAKKLHKELIVTYKNFERFNKQRAKSMTMRIDSLNAKAAKLQTEIAAAKQ